MKPVELFRKSFPSLTLSDPVFENFLTNDSFFDDVFSTLRWKQTYPPYNIAERHNDDGTTGYDITLAVAGFDKEDIIVERERDLLKISGAKKSQESDNKKYIHQGIAARSFEIRLYVSSDAIVSEATLSKGVLTVKVDTPVVEKKKNTIEIKEI